MIRFFRTSRIFIQCYQKTLKWPRIFIISLVCFSSITCANSTDKLRWKQWKKSNNSVISYRYPLDSKQIEIKVNTQIQSSLSGFLLFLQDTNHTPNWLDKAKTSAVIKHVDNTTDIVQTEFSVFWPIQKRIMVIKSQYWQNDDLTVVIQIDDATSMAKNADDAIIVKVISARWMITPIDDNNIAIDYQFMVDAKGTAPKWLINKMTLASTWQTIKNLNQQLPLSAWQHQHIEAIKEYNQP